MSKNEVLPKTEVRLELSEDLRQEWSNNLAQALAIVCTKKAEEKIDTREYYETLITELSYMIETLNDLK